MLHVSSGPRHSRFGRCVAVSVAALSLAIPAGAAGRTDPGPDPPAAGSTPAPVQFPTAEQIAEHRGNPDAVVVRTPASDGSGNASSETLSIALASTALLVALGSVGFAVATRPRISQAHQQRA